MPYVEGESLRDRLRRERQLPVEDALRIAAETARALDYAHRQGVVHRDIKPENILLTLDGDTLVADFGIARALTRGAGDEQLTETGLAIGTPAYMSPEQAAGDKGVDARTDVYSLGAVLYELLAGEPPFTGATTQALLVRRLTEPAPSVRGVRPTVPAGVDEAIRKALAPVAADRFSSVAQFAQALQAAGTAATTATPVPSTVSAPAPPAEAPAAHATPSRQPRRPIPVAALALLLGVFIGLGVLFAWRRSSGSPDADGPRVLAVLPFENLGDSSDAYFADGVTDEVRTKLAQVPGLEVIARGSSNAYRGTAKRAEEIARELGAGYLLTGTVRWIKTPDGGSRVRVTPELVEVRAGQAPRSRWGRQFDAGLTDVFQVQAEIAGRVVSALDVALADSVRRELAAKPTENLEAYDAFLKGEAAAAGLSAGDPPSLRRAIAYYEQAVSLDPAFVPAQAQLARAYSFLFANTAPTPELAEKARLAAERTRALAPDRPDAFLALGTYQGLVLRDVGRALATLLAGVKLAPGNVDLLTAVGQREQALGRWESALKRYERAAALDPRSVSAARRYGYALMALRQYPEAEAAHARARALAPTNLTILHQHAMLKLAEGDRAAAERMARIPVPGMDPAGQVVMFSRFEELAWLLSDDQLHLLLSQPQEAFDDAASMAFVRAQVYALLGDVAKTRAYADSARMAYEDQLREAPDDAQVHALYGVNLAFLGRYADAIREGTRAVTLLPISKDAYLGPYIQLQLARVYMMAGRHDEAVARLEELVRVPNNLSAGWLRVDPTWDPLRKHPGFQKLVEGAQ